MRVTRVVVHADVTSFRHPFFVTGRQPTSHFPAPSTIHGHCAAALGAWPDPATFFFGLHFVWRALGQDVETQHITQWLAAGTRLRIPTPAGPATATTEATPQPVKRDFLFDVTMTLYLPPDVGCAFRRPVHTMALGRSQDLAEVLEVEDIELARPVAVRIEHTLLPWALRPCVRFGSTVLLGRRLAPPPARVADFARYIAVREPVFLGEAADVNRAFLPVDGIPLDDLWSDASVQDEDGFTRGVWLHRLVGSGDG